MFIKKIKEQNLKIRVATCIFITVLTLGLIIFLLSILDNIENNYDYSNTDTLNGVITKINQEDLSSTEESPQYTFHVYITLENDKEIMLPIGGDRNDYEEGQNVIVYTDGKNYSLSKKGISLSTPKAIAIFSSCVIILCFSILIWAYYLGKKGFIIGFLVHMFILLMLD